MANQPLYTPLNPHFFQPLLPGFTNHLDIPVAFFLKHIVGSNKGKTAELRSDASEMTWKVKVDDRRLSDGWQDFAFAHDLRVGDIVVFRQEGELVFHVSPLGPSCCEIQYGEHNLEDNKREKLCETEKVSRKKKNLKREADSAPNHLLDSFFVLTVTASNLKRDTVYIPKEFALSNDLMNKYQIVLMNEEGESWTIDLRHEAYHSGRFNMRRGWRSFCVANGKKPGDLLGFKLVQNEETPVLQLFPLIVEDTENVPRKKSREIEADSSPVVVRDTSCFVATVTVSNLERDRLYLPKTFILSNGLLKKFQMLLMNEKGESWTIDVKRDISGRFLTKRGWRSFCVANGKKPGDFFTFKLVQNEETPVLRLFPLIIQDLDKLEPTNDTRQEKCLQATKKVSLGIEATEKEFLGVEVYRNDSFKASEKDCINEDIRQGQAIKQEYVSTEESNSTSQNLFMTLTLTLSSKLNLPLEFMKATGINKAGKITMLDRYGTRWLTSLLLDKRGTMSLGKGSKGFCEVNGVKMDESFVLELIWEDTVPILKFCSKV